MLSKPRDLLKDTAEKISKEIWDNVILPNYIVDQQDSNGDTDLMGACHIADVPLVKKLLSLNSNVNLVNNAGLNCVLFSVWCSLGQDHDRKLGIEILELLHQAGANFNLQDVEGQTGLIISCRYLNMEDITEKLIDLNCDLNIQTKDGSTALTCACARPYLKCIYLLCTKVKSLEQINNFKAQLKSIKHNEFAIKANLILDNMELNMKLNQNLSNKTNNTRKLKL